MWSSLYFCMAIAAWLVWRQNDSTGAKIPLILFAVQLVLNVLWSCIFFGLENPGLAFVEVLMLWLAIAATMATFWRIRRWPEFCSCPYLAWVGFASVLNLVMWRIERLVQKFRGFLAVHGSFCRGPGREGLGRSFKKNGP